MTHSADQITQEYILESVHLLEQSLHKIEHCLKQLDESQIWWRPQPGLNSIGNLILHLCGNLNQWAVCGISQLPDQREREQEFSPEQRLSADELKSLLHATIDAARRVMLALNAETIMERREIQGFSVSVMGALSHTVTHFVGHTHQIIYLTRQQLGERYQFDWSPDSNQQRVPI